MKSNEETNLKDKDDEEHNNKQQKLEEKMPLNVSGEKMNYSTVNKTQEQSMEINESTTAFDLWKGLFFMFLSCIFKSTFSVLSKYSLKDKTDLSSFQLLTFRTYFMLWMTVILVSVLPINVFSENFVKKDKVTLVCIRTVFAILSMSLVIYTIKHMHISDVYSVYYVYPAFIIILSMFFLKKEKLGVLDYCCLVACFVGAILIVKPEFLFHKKHTASKMIYFGLVVIAAFLKALEDVLIRNVGKDAHYLIFPFMYSIFGMVLFPIPMILFDSVYPKFTFWEAGNVFLIGVCTFCYQMFMALGLQNESASRVSMVNYAQVALMFISDLALFDKTFDLLDLIGTLLIFGFNFGNGLYKTYKRLDSLENYNKKNAISK